MESTKEMILNKGHNLKPSYKTQIHSKNIKFYEMMDALEGVKNQKSILHPKLDEKTLFTLSHLDVETEKEREMIRNQEVVIASQA